MSLLFTLNVCCCALLLLQWGVVSLESHRSVEIQSEYDILSRKRRYLIFPQGSSFQIVWDGIIGIVDYTNYLILGITVALAWELPSQPPSVILEDIKQNFFQNDVKPMEISTTPAYYEHAYDHFLNNTQRRIFSNSIESPTYHEWKFDKSKYYYHKRSLNPAHQRYHRHSRLQLYDKIEKYLERRGVNGHDCVLRALCERNQKHTQLHISFVAALMQAIFSLPLPDAYDEGGNSRQQRYDIAHAFKGKCDTQYHQCKYSLWSSPYLK